MIDLDALERLASEATQHTWHIVKCHDLWLQIDSGYGLERRMLADCLSKRDADYIAACDPPTIKELIRLARIGQACEGRKD